MRHFVTGLGKAQFVGKNGNRFGFVCFSGLWAVAGVLSLTTSFAQESKSANKGNLAPTQAESVTLPEFFEKLKLSSKQQDEVKEIVREYDATIGIVWKQFSERYMQTIVTESALMAAVEENLTETQRKHIREQRRKTAKHEKDTAATTTPAAIVEEELAVAGVTLTAEQEAMADTLQEKYRPRLRVLNKDIQRLHTRLVSLESEKLVAIEKVLTKEQLTQLRALRQTSPDIPKVSDGNSVAK